MTKYKKCTKCGDPEEVGKNGLCIHCHYKRQLELEFEAEDERMREKYPE